MLNWLLNWLDLTPQEIKSKEFWLSHIKEFLQIIMGALLIASILYSTKIPDRIHNWENNLAISRWIGEIHCSSNQKSSDNLNKELDRLKNLDPAITEIIRERNLRLTNLCAQSEQLN